MNLPFDTVVKRVLEDGIGLKRWLLSLLSLLVISIYTTPFISGSFYILICLFSAVYFLSTFILLGDITIKNYFSKYPFSLISYLPQTFHLSWPFRDEKNTLRMLLKARKYCLINEKNKFSILSSILFQMLFFVTPATVIEYTLIDLFKNIPEYFFWDVILILYILNVIENLAFFLSFQKANVTMA